MFRPVGAVNGFVLRQNFLLNVGQKVRLISRILSF